ncbi:hypothetical protein [Poseidonibacter ostreae]|uniref:Uncharacterized protein n=1 Tax=Poseidonibacter ostreae TaxID=2654171 RepID=A0A6L4WX72_9BACT|nr:hypothetical protein [Poseidonibacter ostreae]KAB7891459.1 hypothetical protein GBG19_01060 [Poseidonibacter ostreae]
MSKTKNTYNKKSINDIYKKEMKALNVLAEIELDNNSLSDYERGCFSGVSEFLYTRYHAIFDSLKGCASTDKDIQLINAFMYAEEYNSLFDVYIAVAKYKKSQKEEQMQTSNT